MRKRSESEINNVLIVTIESASLVRLNEDNRWECSSRRRQKRNKITQTIPPLTSLTWRRNFFGAGPCACLQLQLVVITYLSCTNKIIQPRTNRINHREERTATTGHRTQTWSSYGHRKTPWGRRLSSIRECKTPSRPLVVVKNLSLLESILWLILFRRK